MADAKAEEPDYVNKVVVEAQRKKKWRLLPRPRTSKPKPGDLSKDTAGGETSAEPHENSYDNKLRPEPSVPDKPQRQEKPYDLLKASVAGAEEPAAEPPENIYETLTEEGGEGGGGGEGGEGHLYEDMENYSPPQQSESASHWRDDLTPWEDLCSGLTSTGVSERQLVGVKAEQLFRGVRVYVVLMSNHGDSMKMLMQELLSVADNLDKVSKRSKIAGITGGATTAAGSVAAVAGVILAPFTFGISLALTVVGVGLATAGGVTGASAAIANKVNFTMDKMKIENTTQQYKRLLQDIQDCLSYINEGMARIKQHNVTVLSEARAETERVARMIDMSATGETNARAVQVSAKASELIEAFDLGMGTFYVQKKKRQKLRKRLVSKFAMNIRTLVTELNYCLEDLMRIRDWFSWFCSEV